MMNALRLSAGIAFLTAVMGLSAASFAAGMSGAAALTPNLAGHISAPLRYRPEGADFVIRNGGEFFNRPLYGGHSAFRIDGGDKPEFSLYLPGRGGTLRIGLKTPTGAKWLHAADDIETRYRPGELHYEIHDTAWGKGRIVLTVLAYEKTEGMIVEIAGRGLPHGTALIWAFGGADGVRGARDGDIGTENVPIGEYFQFQPARAADNVVATTREGFLLIGKKATIAGVAPRGARVVSADGDKWNDPTALLASAGAARPHPIVAGSAALPKDRAIYLSLQRADFGTNAAQDLDVYRAVSRQDDTRPAPLHLTPIYKRATLAAHFRATRAYFAKLRDRVRIETPDAYLNAAMGALNVAADALWDDDAHAIMHGAIAWRTKLLGWRGPYALDDLGWHDRACENFETWRGKQNVDPVPDALAPPDEAAHLARNEAALHSNGDISHSHYDMNAVFIDALLRHLAWTGDMTYARQAWPVIERHLAWEKRLFRRPFGPKELPLYEAYAQIWASDNIGYGGGGVAYASAYAYFANRQAAKLAGKIGKDPKPYAQEADKIAQAMRQYLWMPQTGAFAEYRDWLGERMLHPSYGLWSFYHTIDSEVPTAGEAWAMAAALDRHLKRIPVAGEDVPSDVAQHVLPSSDWMPYQWSVNNVTMGENLHAALAYWQAGRPDEAYRLTRGAVLASLYMGISPGNIGTMNYLDVYRRESQRDFADGAGTMARALVEGLFGVRPDAIDGRLVIHPGFPDGWTRARLRHPDLTIEFLRRQTNERWRIVPKNPRFEDIRLDLPMPYEKVDGVAVNGRAAAWRIVTAPGRAILRIETKSADEIAVDIRWTGAKTPSEPDFAKPQDRAVVTAFGWDEPVRGKTEAVDLAPYFNDAVTSIFAPDKYRTPRSPFASLGLPSQGIGGWAGNVTDTAVIDDAGLRNAAGGRLALPNGAAFFTPPGTAKNVLFVSQWDNYPKKIRIPLTGKASHAFLLMAGSTNPMQSRIDNGEVVFTYTDGSAARLALDNPVHWWPIDRDYFIDDYQFAYGGELPLRVDLKTGTVRRLDPATFAGTAVHAIPGGAATVLHLPLDPGKQLASVRLHAQANDVVIGLMGLTLQRPEN